MKIKLEKVKEISLITLSFFIPFVLLIILCNVNGLALNGYKNYTMMMIDMQSEYICYLRDLRQILLHGGSLIYTTEKVFGGDYLSIFTFYLSSPFNLFVVFFKEFSGFRLSMEEISTFKKSAKALAILSFE